MAGKKAKKVYPSYDKPKQGMPARAAALAVLNRFRPQAGSTSAALNEMLPRSSERQRTTDLVFGTIRNRSAIDAVIAALGNCPIERIPARLLNIIRIGGYELVYSPATPAYSIVNEAVKNAKAIAGRKQTGFVNALLRQIERHIKNRQVPLSQGAAQRILPQSPASGCEFDAEILPPPEQAPADYLSIAFSLPKWLVAGWLAQFGPERTRQICFASNRRPSIYIRPNVLRTTVAELVERFRKAGIDFEVYGSAGHSQDRELKHDDLTDLRFRNGNMVEQPLIKVKSPAAISDLAGFAEGLFTVQDPTAGLAARLLRPRPGHRILDLCAAPGTKTTQLAEIADDKAQIIANDKDGKRIEKVRENITRLGIKGVRIVAYEHLQQEVDAHGLFDSILLDVPCSNTGVLSKRIEVRYRLRPKTIISLTEVQSELLARASNLVKPNGKICYSTCSIQTNENSEVVESFLKDNGAFELETERLTLPSAEGFDYDGGYAALITGK